MTLRTKRPVALAFVAPCLATSVAQPPDGDQWLHEVKYDGYRVEVILDDGKPQIFTRNGHDWTARFGAVVDDLAALDVKSAVIDGEAVVLDGTGASCFALLQAALKRPAQVPIQIMAFDLIHLDGQSTALLPLAERKALLAQLIARVRLPRGLLRYVDDVGSDGHAIFEKACAMGLEGIVSKRVDRPYRSGRHGDWTKAKCVSADPFVVVGYTLQTGTRGMIGALALGFYDDGELVYAGRVGTGFSVDEARAIADGIVAIHAPAHPLVAGLTGEQKRSVRWVKPQLVAQVAYRDMTPEGLLRHAAFQHFRTDKAPRDIGRPVRR